MFDDVPARFWLLIGIAAAAWAPATYVYRHVANGPDWRDITAPPTDLSWRSSRQLTISAAFLLALGALAIFIFTPAAERFARSPSFTPLLLGGMGLFACFSVAKSMVTGTIEPLVRGFNRTYMRAEQPKRFWAAAVWNGCMGAMFLWGAIWTIGSENQDRCHNYDDKFTPQEQLAACDDVLSDLHISRDMQGDYYGARGIAHHNLRDANKAIDDYNRAIDLDPNDSYALYNRGLLYLEGGQAHYAIEDFSQSLKLRPDNKDAYVNRGEAYLERYAYSNAVADFTKALKEDPRDERTLSLRAMAYLGMSDVDRAEQDLGRLRAVNPSSLGLLQGGAILDMLSQDYTAALRKLNEAHRRDPGNPWTLERLAMVHDRLGHAAEAEAARRKAAALGRKTPG